MIKFFTFRDSANNLSNIIFYDLSQLSLINHHCTLSPELLGLSQDKNLVPKVKKKVGRPKNEEKRAEERKYLQIKPLEMIQLRTVDAFRTKSGRPVKVNQGVDTSIFSPNQFLFESKMTSDDEMFKSHIQFSKTQSKSQELISLTEPPRKQRKISSQFRCSFCKKIYLGKNKMNHHYKSFPNHRLPQNDHESKLFSHLMSMVREKRSNEEMAAEFFREVSTFVQLCEKLTPKLITNLDSENTHQQVIDKNAASLLRINPGNYKINMNVFDKSFKFDSPTQEIDESRGSLTDSTTATESEKLSPMSSKPLIIIDDVPSLDGNECSSLLIKANELTNLTNISLETEDF